MEGRSRGRVPKTIRVGKGSPLLHPRTKKLKEKSPRKENPCRRSSAELSMRIFLSSVTLSFVLLPSFSCPPSLLLSIAPTSHSKLIPCLFCHDFELVSPSTSSPISSTTYFISILLLLEANEKLASVIVPGFLTFSSYIAHQDL